MKIISCIYSISCATGGSSCTLPVLASHDMMSSMIHPHPAPVTVSADLIVAA